MKHYQILFLAAIALVALACGGNNSGEYKQSGTEPTKSSMTSPNPSVEDSPAVHDYLTEGSKGVGPITTFDRKPFDQKLADEGNGIFITQCSMCHRLDAKLLGPPLLGVTKKRTPEWILNMMLAPEKMIAEDPDAKALFEEYQTPMANLGLDENGAKAVLEYLRLEDSK